MYFLFFKPRWGSKRSAAQPQTIYSEVPKKLGKTYTPNKYSLIHYKSNPTAASRGNRRLLFLIFHVIIEFTTI